MVERVRSFDWARTPLGPLEAWPSTLRTIVDYVLSTPAAMIVLWGADGVVLYNDAYAGLAGRRHPDLLGSTGRDGATPVLAQALSEGLAGRPATFKARQVAQHLWMDLAFGPVFDECGGAAGALGAAVESAAPAELKEALKADRQAVLDANQRLNAESAFLKDLFEQAPGFTAITLGEEHVVTLANQAYRRLVGERALLRRPLIQALPELADQGLIGALDRAYATGEPYIGQGVELHFQRDIEHGPDHRILDFIFQPLVGEGGRIDGVFIQGQDVTDRQRSEQHLRLVVNELNHRVKNTLATMQAIAAQTFRQGDDLTFAHAKFAARVMALAKANDLLTREGWAGASLRDVIGLVAQAHAGPDQDRITVEGPVVKLTPKTAMSLSMGIHELATNATKYGALSVAAGRVHVRWSLPKVDGHERLHLEWRELGGPEVVAPARRGFGSRLIDRGLAAELGGTIKHLFEPTGVICRIDAPLNPSAQTIS
jgi:two-component sensor histidine kinase/PAS domain-containing protein